MLYGYQTYVCTYLKYVISPAFLILYQLAFIYCGRSIRAYGFLISSHGLFFLNYEILQQYVINFSAKKSV